jgi:hypothetical protein
VKAISGFVRHVKYACHVRLSLWALVTGFIVSMGLNHAAIEVNDAVIAIMLEINLEVLINHFL